MRLAAEANTSCALEIGCGTGNSAQALSEEWPCQIAGLDLPLPMLRQAKVKQALSVGEECILVGD